MLADASIPFGFLLLLSISLPLTNVSSIISYGSVLVVYSVLLLFVMRKPPSITIDRIYLTLLCLLAGNLILSSIVSPSVGSMMRVGAFFIFTLTNLLVLPYVVSLPDLMYLATRYAAGLTVIGLLPYLGVDNIFGMIDLSLWDANLYVPSGFQPITSIFFNPNSLGFVLMVGAIAGTIETMHSRKADSAMFTIISVCGLILTNYRTGMVSFGIIISLCAVYVQLGRRAYTAAVIGGLTIFSLVLMMMFGFLPGPESLRELSLNGRRLLWRNTAAAIQQAPLGGFGFGNYAEVVDNPHNSYLRMFLALGVVGGLTYTVFVLRAVYRSTYMVDDWYTLGISLYLIAFFFVQMMNSLTFIGISFHSVCISVLIGYHLQTIDSDSIELWPINT